MFKLIWVIVIGMLITVINTSWGQAKSWSDNDNGTVNDFATGLMWQQDDDDVARSFVGAVSYCENLTLGGKTDWRLPNVKELRTLGYDLAVSPRISSAEFPDTETSEYWSVTGASGSPLVAWHVDFNNGTVATGNVSETHFVRCVR
ncbi:MAG: DUF1566 domain-containing protein [Pseudomonadota bacterium]